MQFLSDDEEREYAMRVLELLDGLKGCEINGVFQVAQAMYQSSTPVDASKIRGFCFSNNVQPDR